jgi:hypothetical protein
MANSFEFKEVNILDVNQRDEAYRYRWLSHQKINQQNNTRGWEVVNNLNKKNEGVNQSKNFLNSVSSLDSTMRVGDLVLARMPKEMAESRNQYYRKRYSTGKQIESLKAAQKGTGSMNVSQVTKVRGNQSADLTF